MRRRRAVRAPVRTDTANLWALAVRACGASVSSADAVCEAHSASADDDDAGDTSVLEEYLRVCARAGDAGAAVRALRSAEVR